MLFLLFIVLLVLFILLWCIGDYGFDSLYEKIRNKKRKKEEKLTFKEKLIEFLYYNEDGMIQIGAIGTIVMIFVCVICLICLICSYVGLDAQIALKDETYKALCYKIECDEAKDELGLRNKDVIDEVQRWNENIVYHQKIQDDFWVGIFYPNIYDDFEIIDLSKYSLNLSE